MTVRTVGLDLAKKILVHCVSAIGHRVINKKIMRARLLSSSKLCRVVSRARRLTDPHLIGVGNSTDHGTRIGFDSA